MKVQEWKKQEVESLKHLILEYPVIGVVDSTNLPSMQLQKMRFKLKPDVLIKMTKSRLLKLALEQLKDKKQGIEKLEEYLRYNIPILLFSKKDSFKLSKFLIKNKSSAPARPGQKAPNDIIVSAGPTEFTPGPVIGELGQAGLKTGVEGGKIVIKEDKLVVKEGDVITDKVAAVLTKLGIQPMKIGFNLLATYDGGLIYNKNVLDIDEEKTINELKLAASYAFNLSFKIGYPTKQNIKLFLQRASLESKALESKVNMEEIKSAATKEYVKEEPKVEEKQTIIEKPKFEERIEVKHEPKIEHHVKEEKMEEKMEPIEEETKVEEETQSEEVSEAPEQKIKEKKDYALERDSMAAQEVLKRLQDEKLKKPMDTRPFKEKPAKKVGVNDVFKR